MASARTISIRLGIDGALELKQQLEGAGSTGSEALNKISAALTKLGAQDTSAVSAALDRISASAQRTAATVGQATANSFAGVQDPTSDTDYTKRAADIAAYGTQLDALRAKYVPLFAVSKQYETSLDEIGQAEKVGALSSSEAAAARDKLTASFAAAAAPTAAGTDAAIAGASAVTSLGNAHGNASKTVGLFGLDMQRSQVLVHDSIKTFAELGAGMPPLLVAIQHVGQAQYVFGDIGTAAKALGSAILSPIGAVVAFSAAVGGLIVVAENENTRLAGVREQLRATQTGYDALAVSVEAAARSVAAATTLSTSQARDAAQTIAGAKYFSGTETDIEQLIKLSGDLARIWNTDVAKASGILRDAINDPAKAAKDFAEQGLPAFNAALVQNVEQLQASGKGGAALSLVLDNLRKSSSGAAADQTPLQKALHDLESSFYGAQTGGKSLATTLGEALAVPVTGAIRLITDLVDAIKHASDDANNAAFKAAQNAAAIRQSAVTGSNAVTTPDATGQPALLGPVIPGSSERATGLFQVLPSTGRSLGYDVTSQDQNILAGLTYLQQQVDKLGGVNPALAQYGGYGTDVARASSYIGKVQGANAASLPTDIAGQIEYWGQILGMTPDMIALGQRLAVVESGGHQYASPGLAAAAATATAAAPAASPAVALSPVTVSAVRNDGRANADAAAQAVQSINPLSQQVEQNQALQQLLQSQLDVAKAAGDTSGYDRLSAALAVVKGRATDLITEQQKLARASTDAVQPLGAQEGVTRTLAQVQQQFAQAARAAGTSIDQSALLTAQTNKLIELKTAYNDNVAAVDRQTAANQAIVASIDGSAASYLAATNREKALAAARDAFLPGPDRDAAVDRYTAALNRQTASVADLATAQKAFDQRDQLDLIQAETAALGQNQDEAAKQIALLKEKQDLVKRGADLQSAASQADLANVAAIADATAALQHQKDTLAELSGFFDSTFSTISDAITSAFAVGQAQAVKFGDVAKSVANAIESEFLKLALLNPLKNALFGTSTPTLSSVNGLLGSLFGGSGNTISTSDSSWVVGGASGINGEVNDSFGNSVSPSDLTSEDLANKGKTATIGATGGISLSTVGSIGGAALKTADIISGGAGTDILSGVKSYVFDAVGYTPGTSIGAWVSSLVGEETGGVAAGSTGALGGAASETADVAGGAVAAGEAGASVGEAGVGTIGAAANTIAEAVPYIGAAVSIITDLATGNLRGAAIVATTTAVGAVVGSVIPGIGTAIGAGVGATVGVLIDTFFPQHPKNPYQATDVDVDSSGHIVAGRSVSQLESTDAAQQEINDFGDQLGQYLDAVKVDIVNRGNLGNVGSGIKGLTQVDDVNDLFPNLRFTNDPSDTGNFGIAKQGDLADASFANVGALNDELTKVAKFSDGLDQLGIKLYSVGKGLTDITIASVSLTGALDAQGNAIINPDADPNAAPDPLRVALDTDLSGKTFATVDALGAEIDKVETFVDTTLPGLLNPVVAAAVSSLQQQIADENKTYDAAESQAKAYGLDPGPLYEAETKADSLLIAPARKQLDQQEQGINDRDIVATHTDPISQFQASFNDLQVTDEQQRDALIKSLTDVYGDAVKGTAYYFQQLGELNQTLADEAAAKVTAFYRQQTTNGLSLEASQASITGRQYALAGDQEDSDLVNYDAKAAQEQDSYSNELIDFYGQQYTTTAVYQAQITQLEQVQQGERLAIIQKYADAATQATAQAAQVQQQQLVQAQDNVASLYSSLGDYATKLQTGSNSPLSAQDQYALASSQFNAVLGAAQAGDYTSAGQLQSYSDTLLSASRAINESGTGYAADFQRVLDGLQSVTTVSDALTASAQKQIAQDAADKTIAAGQDDTAKVVDAVTALRREVQMLNLKLTQAA